MGLVGSTFRLKLFSKTEHSLVLPSQIRNTSESKSGFDSQGALSMGFWSNDKTRLLRTDVPFKRRGQSIIPANPTQA